MNKLTKFTLIFFSYIIFSLTASAEVVLIIHKDNPMKQIKRTALIDIYLGRHFKFPHKQQATPINQKETSIVQNFHRQILKINSTKHDIYWARLSFSGRARPPKVLENNQAVLDYVAKNKNAIGYIDHQLINQFVKRIPVSDKH